MFITKNTDMFSIYGYAKLVKQYVFLMSVYVCNDEYCGKHLNIVYNQQFVYVAVLCHKHTYVL